MPLGHPFDVCRAVRASSARELAPVSFLMSATPWDGTPGLPQAVPPADPQAGSATPSFLEDVDDFLFCAEAPDMDLSVKGPATRLVRLLCSPGLDLLFSYTHLEEVLGSAVRPKTKIRPWRVLRARSIHLRKWNGLCKSSNFPSASISDAKLIVGT